MKQFLLFLIILFAGIALHAQEALKNLIVETYYISDANDAKDIQYYRDNNDNIIDTVVLAEGTTTYRVYVQLQKGYKLKSIFGDKQHALIIKSTDYFYNHASYNQSYGKDISEVSLKRGTVALDSWLTIGQTTKTKSNKTYFGILKSTDTNGSILAPNNMGYLANTNEQMGASLALADGMDTMAVLPSFLPPYGFDTSIFNTAKLNSFLSNDAYINVKDGFTGVNRDSNIILIAQLTTKGKLSFELNILVTDEKGNDKYYIARGKDSAVVKIGSDGKDSIYYKYSDFLTYPKVDRCGCNNPDYIEYRYYKVNRYNCSNPDSCKRKIIFGCKDKKACNYNPDATDNMLCCYPGDCQGRDIEVACKNIVNEPEVSLFPNPANNMVQVELKNMPNENSRVSVFDIYGKKLFNLSTNQTIFEFDVSTFNKGIYVVKVQNSNNTLINKRLVRN
jgi:hypothetical protein